MKYTLHEKEKEKKVLEKLNDIEVNVTITGLEAILIRALLHRTNTKELREKIKNSDFFDSDIFTKNELASSDFLSFINNTPYIVKDYMHYANWNSLYKEILQKL